MNPSKFAASCALAAALVLTLAVHAQAPGKPADNLDVTMTLLPEHAKGPEDITRRITLPPPANPDAGRRADKPDSRDDGKSPPTSPGPQGQGRDTADAAYYAAFLTGAKPIVEKRLGDATSGVVSVVVSAWEAAGRPKLPVDPVR